MASELETAVSLIEKLGLTTYQARVYAALVGIGREASAPEVSVVSGVPKSRIYDVLEELASKEYQLVRKIPSKDPRRYNYIARPPKEALDEFIDPVKEAAKQALEELYQRGKQGTKDQVPTVYEEKATLKDLAQSHVELIISPNEELTHGLRSLMKTPEELIPIITLAVNGKENDMFCGVGKEGLHFFRFNPFGNLTVVTLADKGINYLFRAVLGVLGDVMTDGGVARLHEKRIISLMLAGEGVFKSHQLTTPHFLILTPEHLQVMFEGKVDVSVPVQAIREIKVLDVNQWFTTVKFMLEDAHGTPLGTLQFKLLGDATYLSQLFRQ